MDLVSIIIPTYQRAHLISETLDSVLKQTYQNWECIIVDDGSSDNTNEVLLSYMDKDPRFSYYQRPEYKPKGANSCRNYGFEKANGKYIKWFDSDDIMKPEFIEKQVLILEADDKLDFCATFSETFSDSVENIVGLSNPEIITCDVNNVANFILGKIIFLTPSPLWRCDFLNNKELFDETLSNAHETDFNFRRLVEGGQFKYLTDTCFYVRRGHESIDSLSKFNFSNTISYFAYTQKNIDYLNQEIAHAKTNVNIYLLTYIIKKQMRMISRTRSDYPIFKACYLAPRVFRNIFNCEISLLNKCLLSAILLMIILFKKGYKFLYFASS